MILYFQLTSQMGNDQATAMHHNLQENHFTGVEGVCMDNGQCSGDTVNAGVLGQIQSQLILLVIPKDPLVKAPISSQTIETNTNSRVSSPNPPNQMRDHSDGRIAKFSMHSATS